jgi:hypothetical protein
MTGDEQLDQLIFTYEALAATQDAVADSIVTMAEREGWHDDATQAVEWARHAAKTSRYLAEEVRASRGSSNDLVTG